MASVNQLAVLFILLALGFAGCRLKALTPETGQILTKLVFNITLPCTMLSSAITGELGIGALDTLLFILKVILVYFIYLAIALPLSRVFGGNKRLRGLYAFMMIFANVAFMGIPVASAVFGPDAVFYISVFGIPFWISSFTFGSALVAGKADKFEPKSLLTPVFITSMLVVPLALLNFRAPDIIVDALGLAGSITTPASMLIIGVTLAQEPIKAVFKNVRLYPIAFIKLIVIPTVVWLILRLFLTDPYILGILVLLSAMPTAAIAAMFAIEHKNNETVASGGVFITTLFSGITIPLIIHIFAL